MLGYFLRAVRQSAGLKQSEVAVLAGVSQPNISAYESDARMPTAETLNKLIVACGYQLAAVSEGGAVVRCEWPLLFGAGWLPGDPPDEEPSLDPRASAATRGRVLFELPRAGGFRPGALAAMSLSGLLIEVHGLLGEHGVPHAFGGALALAYYADPRATYDIDVNAFVALEDAPRIVALLRDHALESEREPGAWIPNAGVRLSRAGETGKIDVFFSLDEAYEEIATRVRWFPFGSDPQVDLPFLSAEDLVVFKISFGRPKDWLDLESMLDTDTGLDRSYVERKLIEIRGPRMRPRLARFEAMVRRRTE